MRRTSKAFALSSMLGSLAFGSGALAQDGSEVDLTGTWEGAQICDELIEGEFIDFVVVDNLLLVVQDGDTFRFVFVGDEEELPTISSMRVSFKMSKAATTSRRWLASAVATTKPRSSSGCGGLKPPRTAAASMPIPSSLRTTSRRPRGFSISIPASGRTSGCRRSGPTCRSASDQAFARRNDEGDKQANSRPDVLRQAGGAVLPRPRLPWAGLRAECPVSPNCSPAGPGSRAQPWPTCRHLALWPAPGTRLYGTIARPAALSDQSRPRMISSAGAGRPMR